MEGRRKNPHAVALGRIGGRKRAQALSEKRRSEIAQKAARARWARVQTQREATSHGTRPRAD